MLHCLPLSAAILLLSGLLHAEEALIRCQQIRALPRVEAAKSLPVRVTASVTFVKPKGDFVVEDETGGLYVGGRNSLIDPTNTPHPKVGDVVEIRGVSAAGGFVPVIIPLEIRVLGSAPLPTPRNIDLSDLMLGRWSGCRVLIQGVAQRVLPSMTMPGEMLIHVKTREGFFLTSVQNGTGVDPTSIVDATVKVTGTCFSIFNSRGEGLGSYVQCLSKADLDMVRAPPADPFAVPEVQPYALSPFDSQADTTALHRQRLTGVVTLWRSGEFMYVQTKQRGFRVTTTSGEAFAPGDHIEASGFVAMTSGYGSLTEALVRKLGVGTLPLPLDVTVQQVMGVKPDPMTLLRQEDYDGARVRLSGRLIDIESKPSEDHRLFLQCGDDVIIATMGAAVPKLALTHLRNGSDLSVTAICSIRYPAQSTESTPPTPESFSLIVHSPTDIAITSEPSQWTAQRLTKLLVAAGIILAFLITRLIVLRTRIRWANAKLAAERLTLHDREIEFQATLEERHRLAADLHDTLEQALTGVAMQLSAVQRSPNPERIEKNLTLAAKMLKRSHEEVRLSVWNLRAQALEGQHLRAALRQVAGQLSGADDVAIHVGGTGHEVALPDLIGGSLLMLAKEALTNALKHGEPTRIDLHVDYESARVTLTIVDDGKGFSPTSVAGASEGHFGLTGMADRTTRIGGYIRITSHPGQGTKVIVQIPLNQRITVLTEIAPRTSQP